MPREVIQSAPQRGTITPCGKLAADLADPFHHAPVAVFQKLDGRPVSLLPSLRRSLAEDYACRLCQMFGSVVNVEVLSRSGKALLGKIPDPLGAVSQDTQR